jgi:hypothetical protein
MNNMEKIFIVNNQEDEDGDNLFPGNRIINEQVISVPGKYPRNNAVNKKAAIIKLQSRRKFAFASVAEKKKTINSE